jgi:hypothetical protein
MNSIEETDPQFLNKLQQNGLDPYLMNKEQIEKQYSAFAPSMPPADMPPIIAAVNRDDTAT